MLGVFFEWIENGWKKKLEGSFFFFLKNEWEQEGVRSPHIARNPF